MNSRHSESAIVVGKVLNIPEQNDVISTDHRIELIHFQRVCNWVFSLSNIKGEEIIEHWSLDWWGHCETHAQFTASKPANHSAMIHSQVVIFVVTALLLLPSNTVYSSKLYVFPGINFVNVNERLKFDLSSFIFDLWTHAAVSASLFVMFFALPVNVSSYESNLLWNTCSCIFNNRVKSDCPNCRRILIYVECNTVTDLLRISFVKIDVDRCRWDLSGLELGRDDRCWNEMCFRNLTRRDDVLVRSISCCRAVHTIIITNVWVLSSGQRRSPVPVRQRRSSRRSSTWKNMVLLISTEVQRS